MTSYNNYPKCPNWSCDDEGAAQKGGDGRTWLKCSVCDNITKRDPAECDHPDGWINEVKQGANTGKHFKKCKECKEFLGFCSPDGTLEKPTAPYKKRKAPGAVAVSPGVPRKEFDALCLKVVELEQRVFTVETK